MLNRVETGIHQVDFGAACLERRGIGKTGRAICIDAIILQASSPQIISGVHAIDWNGDGDVDLLTGQGHGGSGLRYYERDWIDDELRDTHPRVSVTGFERKSTPPR